LGTHDPSGHESMHKTKPGTCHRFFNRHIFVFLGMHGFGLAKPIESVSTTMSSLNAFSSVHKFWRVRRIEVRAWTKVIMRQL